MKLYELSIGFILIMLVLAAIASYIGKKITGKDDNYIEQKAEEILKDTTNIDIDFSPNNIDK